MQCKREGGREREREREREKCYCCRGSGCMQCKREEGRGERERDVIVYV